MRAVARLAAALAALLLVASASVSAAPNEEVYGAGQGYPKGDRDTWIWPTHMVGAFSAMEQLYPARTVAAGSQPRALAPSPAASAAAGWKFIRNYLDQHPATGLLVLKDGEVLAEHYQYGRNAQHRFTSFSMAKTVVAMAVGIAVAEGRIASIDAPVDQLEPALADTAWKGVTLRQVLNMSSGVRFDETYDKPDTDIARFSRPWTRQQGTLLGSLQQLTEREGPAGERFRYISPNTQVLAQVLIRATGRPLAEYVGEKLWTPMGAEADAAWLLDAGGTEAGHCCLSARLRDWGRFGQLLLERGQREGRSIIPAAWVEAATSTRPQDIHLLPHRATPYFGYGYQTWIFPDGLGFALLGVRGQAVFVNPALRLVMVQTAVWPSSTDVPLARQRDRFWRELVRAVGAL